MSLYPAPRLRAVFLEGRIQKFLLLNDRVPLSEIDPSPKDLRKVIRAFYPDILIGSSAKTKHLVKIFEVLVQPCFDNFEEYEGATCTMYYRPIDLCKCHLFTKTRLVHVLRAILAGVLLGFRVGISGQKQVDEGLWVVRKSCAGCELGFLGDTVFFFFIIG